MVKRIEKEILVRYKGVKISSYRRCSSRASEGEFAGPDPGIMR